MTNASAVHAATPTTDQTKPLEHVGFLSGPFRTRTWREFGYLFPMLVLTPFTFAYVIFVVVFSAGLTFTIMLWLPVLGWLVVGARGPGSMYRGLARAALRADIPAPPRFRRGSGFWGSTKAALSDSTGWRALAYCFVVFPLAVVAAPLSVGLLAGSLGMITYVVWYGYLPEQLGDDGELHRGAQLLPGQFVDTPARIAVYAALGVLLLFVWAAVNRGLATVHRGLAMSLLSPTPGSLRVRELERTRGRSVQDADATLRRIERDLHDGTQARLVTIAMQLGDVRDQLATTDVGDDLRRQVEVAHESTKETLTELRDLARGIRPPALDNGLAVALETLAARSTLPVTVRTDLPPDPADRPAAAIEAIAYFGVSELVNNAVRHARASQVDVSVRARDERLWVRVHDDGVGGAVVLAPEPGGRGSGLAGLHDRVAAVDGSLEVVSPDGGPTTVTIVLPLRVDGGSRP